MMDRDTWLGRILDATRDLADEAYQERVWVRAQGPRSIRARKRSSGSFTTTSSRPSLPRPGDKAWLSNNQLAALRALEDALERYAARDDSGGSDAARIAAPAWRRMRKLANATLETFAARAASA